MCKYCASGRPTLKASHIWRESYLYIKLSYLDEKPINRIELHYFFDDDSHLIDAFVRHKCETEVLAIANDLITTLGYDIGIFAEIPAEGGFKDVWKFISKNSAPLSFVISVVISSTALRYLLQIPNLKIFKKKVCK